MIILYCCIRLCIFPVYLFQVCSFLQCFRLLYFVCLLIYAEDDPNDADFDPDSGVTSGRTAKQVIPFLLLE